MKNPQEIIKIKEQIFENVKRYYEKKFKDKSEFVPGQTTINYGGRIFDEKELINLVDSSLEFWLTEGSYAKRFSGALSSLIDTKYCILTNSGSSANLLAISALKSQKLEPRKRLKREDEIITVAAGFPTTIFPIIQNQVIPVFVDIELETYNIDVLKLESALSEKTKAVMLAHTLGNPFNIEIVDNFCKSNNLWLIEDNSDGLGSKYKDHYTGSFGDISTFSFYPAHHITTGEGGAILTSNPDLYKIIKSLRDWGRDCWCPTGHDNTCKKRFSWKLGTLPYGYDHKYIYSEFGYNLKMTDLQAAIGLAQLEKLPHFIEIRRKNHNLLYESLKSLEDFVILPKAQKNSEPSWFGFLLTLKENVKLTRNEISRELEKQKIQTRTLFAGNVIRHPVFNEMRESNKGYKVIGELHNTDKVMNDSFWIGVYPGLTEEIINYIINQIRRLFESLI